MNKEELIDMARKSDFEIHLDNLITWDGIECTNELTAFAKLVAEHEREVVATWIMDRGFATGHGDSIVDLLDQLEWQIAEKEREACAKLLETTDLSGLKDNPAMQSWVADMLLAYVKAIRARGQA